MNGLWSTPGSQWPWQLLSYSKHHSMIIITVCYVRHMTKNDFETFVKKASDVLILRRRAVSEF